MAVSHYNKLPHHIAVRAKKYRLPKLYEDRWRKDLIGALDTLILLPTDEGPEYWQRVKEEYESGLLLSLDGGEIMVLNFLRDWPYKTFSYRQFKKVFPPFMTQYVKQVITRLRALGKIKFNGKKYEVIDG